MKRRCKQTKLVLYAGMVMLIIGLGATGFAASALAADKPNILVIFGDDVGMWNVGAYTHGMMGRTPNIDRIAKEGMLFTDHYAQPSCTAGRAAFITGQIADPHRHDHDRHSGLDTGAPEAGPDPGRSAEAARLYHAVSSARTISATATSSCRPYTVSTSSTAISITSMPRKSPSSSTIRA